MRGAAQVLIRPRPEARLMNATIRNCPSATRRECQWFWNRLTPSETPSVRTCGGCDRPVYLCDTDEETSACARAGRVIARETPTDEELGSEFHEIAPGHKLPLAWMPGTPEQEQARHRRSREQRIDDAIGAVRYSSRDCPECHYPIPNYRRTCYVCGFLAGRVED